MPFRLAFMRAVLVAGLALAASGCIPSSDRQVEEQKEGHFLAGKQHLNTLNYRAAVDAFEKALEVNPRSASAHFELGLLYEQRVSVPNAAAVAIYHFDKFLQLRPNSEHAEIVKQKIAGCKQEIAKPIALAPGTQSILRDLERLKVENVQLKGQLDAWQAYYANKNTAAPPAPSLATSPAAPVPPVAAAGVRNPSNAPPATASAARKHEVKAGDTPASIAKRHSISVNALMAANPGVDARRLKIGQVLNIPTR